jgi:hypothetical protein
VADLEALTADDFAPLRDQPFRLSADGPPLALTLVEVTAGDGGRPFSLLFRGPAEPLLPQRIYRIEHQALGALELFLVPVGREPDGLRYEAVFT